MLYREGLTIYTTLDTHAQELAEKALDQGLRELDKRHRSYKGLHVNVPQEDWPGALRVLVQSNGELAEGKVVAGLVKDFDAKTGACTLYSARKGRPSGIGMGMDAFFDKTRRKTLSHRRRAPAEACQAAGREDLDSLARTGPQHGRGAR